MTSWRLFNIILTICDLPSVNECIPIRYFKMILILPKGVFCSNIFNKSIFSLFVFFNSLCYLNKIANGSINSKCQFPGGKWTLNAFFKLVHTISNDWSDEFGSAFFKNVRHCYRYRLTIIWLPIVYNKCFMNFLKDRKKSFFSNFHHFKNCYLKNLKGSQRENHFIF